MLFLADESCDFAVVRALRAAGHDVVAIANTVQKFEKRLTGSFVVLRPNQVRIGRSPAS